MGDPFSPYAMNYNVRSMLYKSLISWKSLLFIQPQQGAVSGRPARGPGSRGGRGSRSRGGGRGSRGGQSGERAQRGGAGSGRPRGSRRGRGATTPVSNAPPTMLTGGLPSTQMATAGDVAGNDMKIRIKIS